MYVSSVMIWHFPNIKSPRDSGLSRRAFRIAQYWFSQSQPVRSELSSLPWGKSPADTRRKYMGCCCSPWRPQFRQYVVNLAPRIKLGVIVYPLRVWISCRPLYTSMSSPLPIVTLTILLNPINYPRESMFLYVRKQKRLRIPRYEPHIWPVPT